MFMVTIMDAATSSVWLELPSCYFALITLRASNHNSKLLVQANADLLDHDNAARATLSKVIDYHFFSKVS